MSVLQGSGAFFGLKIQDAASREQFVALQQEVQSLIKLRNTPNVVQIKDHAVCESTLNIVILLELGVCDLEGFFKQGARPALNTEEILSIWTGVVGAVDAAHAAGILHRDLKPSNFLLVPKTRRGERVLATTPTKREDFV